MVTLSINGSEYRISAVHATKRAFRRNIGVHVQLQVFKNGEQIDKDSIDSYAMEKIEEFVERLF